MDLFPLRDVIRPLTGQTTVQIFGSMPDLRFYRQITHMRLDKFIAQQLGVSRALPGVKSAAIVSPSMAKSSVISVQTAS